MLLAGLPLAENMENTFQEERSIKATFLWVQRDSWVQKDFWKMIFLAPLLQHPE